ncbi:MAG: hypothetical protein DPW18_05480 [Chloroflexi bacterium]|nr:hypothetical protein [Chloroflexota bacterium]
MGISFADFNAPFQFVKYTISWQIVNFLYPPKQLIPDFIVLPYMNNDRTEMFIKVEITFGENIFINIIGMEFSFV